MTKEEAIIKAIGMLPEEMIAQAETEEIYKGAVYIEKKENRRVFLYRSCYAIAAVLCIILIMAAAININISKNSSENIPDISNNASADIDVQDKNGSSQSYSNENKGVAEESSINCFVMAYTGGKEDTWFYTEDNIVKDTGSLQYTGFKKVSKGSTVKLQAVKDIQDNSASKKKTEAEYVVFSFDKDFYLTVSNFNETGMTYIMDNQSRKKRYIKGGEEFCKAGSYVYLDISGLKAVNGSYKDNIKAWDKKGIDIIISTKIRQKDGDSIKDAGVFYIGVKQKKKNNKERNVYYGRFENKN